MMIRFDLQDCFCARAEHDGMLAVYALTTRARLWRTHAHNGKLTALDWRPDSRLLASGGDDGCVHLWLAATGKLVETLKLACPIQQVRWSWDGSQLAATTRHGISVWKPQRLVCSLAPVGNTAALLAPQV
jgi:WD40 repeat protein